MKKLYLGLGILALLLLMSLAHVHHLEQATSALLPVLEEARLASGRGETTLAASITERAFRDWKALERYGGVLVRHSALDDVSSAFYACLEQLYDGGSAETGFRLLLEKIEELNTMEQVHWGSVF